MKVPVWRFALMALLSVSISSCFTGAFADQGSLDFRDEMRRFVIEISSYAKSRNRRFAIIPQNGQELLTDSGLASGEVVSDYLNAIEAVGREDLFYGYVNDNERTPADAEAYMIPYLTLAVASGLEVLTIDYCSSSDKMDDSIRRNGDSGFLVFAADRRALDKIPDYPTLPVGENDDPVLALEDAANFLYLINPARYPLREDLVSALEESSYDILIIDLFDNDGFPLSREEIDRLKEKPSGARRLVIAYMSIGEAEDYRFYWHARWKSFPPAWLDEENADWPGNYKVRYWDPRWKEIIYGGDRSYLDLILDRGFDGVYLDLIDAFEFYEK